tara:strand:- start:297 stop:443 length:147 start_codon:yes stop_codon:yes gene_type:complete
MISYYENSSMRKEVLLGFKVLELKIVSIGKTTLGCFKKGDLKLFNKNF